ncbi:nitrite reductase [Nocardioides sp. SYSU DS0651]|uniref:nitrite reductase n=1 Tax=Nocardioides sp. SYSU DS0651 TaxID=3415955 RepID=UPI003F4B68F0
MHPWPADDGGLVRVRLPGGRIATGSLQALVAVAERYGDGRVRVTGRANLQLRGMPLDADRLAQPALAAVEATGVLPSRSHDRARNVLCSPQTGIAGGRADLRPVVGELDRLLLADDELAGLPGRFLFTLDDGRGDLADRHRDLGLVALDRHAAQLVIGAGHGPVVPLAAAAEALAGLARRFLAVRGDGPGAPWHVDELAEPLTPVTRAAPAAEVSTPALPHGPVAGGEHVAVGDGGIDAALAAHWASRAPEVVVTPWHGVLVPEERKVVR